MEAEVFLDTGYAIALANRADQYHAAALSLATDLETAKTHIVTTRAVLLEIGNALGRLRYRMAGIQLLTALLSDPAVTIVSLTDDLFTRAFVLYQQRLDKEWGLIDCVSFVVMGDHRLREALTPDEHYEQAGFRALLKPGP
jgi:uncharacterized protein